MKGREDTAAPSAVAQPLFATTHWSVVLAAGDRDSSHAAVALEKLCRTYWYPLYSYLRRRGYGHEDAQDLTQGFLLQLLEKKSLARVEAGRGRFRSFLLTGLKYFVADQHDRALAQKRGGGHPAVSLFDPEQGAHNYRLEPVDDWSPDRLFERQWALTLLDQVLKKLEEEFASEGKSVQFRQLRRFLVAGRGEKRYEAAGAELGLSAEAVKKAVLRMRHRYGELFRQEVAHTLADPVEIEQEMRYLRSILAD